MTTAQHPEKAIEELREELAEMTKDRDEWKLRHSIIETKLSHWQSVASAALTEARETNTRLNRRVQSIESLAAENERLRRGFVKAVNAERSLRQCHLSSAWAAAAWVAGEYLLAMSARDRLIREAARVRACSPSLWTEEDLARESRSVLSVVEGLVGERNELREKLEKAEVSLLSAPIDVEKLRHDLSRALLDAEDWREHAQVVEKERDEAVRLRESDSKSLAWAFGEVGRVAEALGIADAGKATISQVVERAKDVVRQRDAWAKQCNYASESHADALSKLSECTKERDEARALAERYREERAEAFAARVRFVDAKFLAEAKAREARQAALNEAADHVATRVGIAKDAAGVWALRRAVQSLRSLASEAAQQPAKPAVGTPGVRDPDAPCIEYAPGRPAGDCESDGHYLCRECTRMQPRPLSEVIAEAQAEFQVLPANMRNMAEWRREEVRKADREEHGSVLRAADSYTTPDSGCAPKVPCTHWGALEEAAHARRTNPVYNKICVLRVCGPCARAAMEEVDITVDDVFIEKVGATHV